MPKKLSNVKAFFKLIMMIICFRLLLDYGYINFVYESFEYSGFAYELNYTKLFISWVSILLIFIIVFIKRNNPLIYIYFLIYCITILPTSSYYALSNNSQQSFWATLAVFTIILVLLPHRRKNYNLKESLNEKKQNIIITIVIVISAVNLAYLVYAAKGQYVLSLEDVYDYRASNSDSYFGILGYLNNWTPKIFVPLLIAIGFIRKSKIIITISIVFCISFFAFTGHKSVLLPVILCIFLNLVFKTGSEDTYFERFFVICLSGLIMFSALGLVLYLLNGQALFGSILFRRAFFVPVFLNDIYFDMFSELYTPIYWSNGLLSSFVNYPYGNEPATRVVGAYLNLPNSNANTGFIASGFMNARYIGISIYTIILVIINFSLLRISHRVNPIMFNAILLIPILTLFNSSDLPTAILTHGLLLALVILYLYSGVLKIRTQS